MLIRIRRDTAANLASHNPILQAGELACETDTGKVKLGNAVTAWASLPYLHEVPGDVVVSATTVSVETSRVTGDANPRYRRYASGRVELGVGAFGADTYLQRGSSAPGLETGTDVEILTAAAGLILTDRTTAARYRLKVDSGTLGVEAA